MTRKKFVFDFEEGDGKNKQLLGGKGANLCGMTQIGLPVPPGFVITTEACLKYFDENKKLPKGLMEEVGTIWRTWEKERQGVWVQDQPPFGFGPLGIGPVHAGHDGYHFEPGIERRNGRRPLPIDQERTFRLRCLPALFTAFRQDRPGHRG